MGCGASQPKVVNAGGAGPDLTKEVHKRKMGSGRRDSSKSDSAEIDSSHYKRKSANQEKGYDPVDSHVPERIPSKVKFQSLEGAINQVKQEQDQYREQKHHHRMLKKQTTMEANRARYESDEAAAAAQIQAVFRGRRERQSESGYYQQQKEKAQAREGQFRSGRSIPPTSSTTIVPGMVCKYAVRVHVCEHLFNIRSSDFTIIDEQGYQIAKVCGSVFGGLSDRMVLLRGDFDPEGKNINLQKDVYAVLIQQRMTIKSCYTIYTPHPNQEGQEPTEKLMNMPIYKFARIAQSFSEDDFFYSPFKGNVESYPIWNGKVEGSALKLHKHELPSLTCRVQAANGDHIAKLQPSGLFKGYAYDLQVGAGIDPLAAILYLVALEDWHGNR